MSKQKLPIMNMRAALSPGSTVDADKRTVDITWTTGARGLREYWGGRYFEELGMKPTNLRMTRAKRGLPLVDGHQAWDNDRNLGIVEGIKIEKGADGERLGFGVARFDTHELAQRRFESVQNGIMRDISVGYRVYKFERVGEADDGNGEMIPVLRAVDWEPIEISLVSAGFDADAKTRANEAVSENEVVISGSLETTEQDPQNERSVENPEVEVASMPTENPAPVVEPKVNEEAVRSEAVKAERSRVKEITEDCERSGLSDLARGFIESGVSPDVARREILTKIAERNVTSTGRVEGIRDENETRHAAIVGAVLHRANPRVHKLDDNARRFMPYSLCDIARELTGEKGSNGQVVERALQTTSQFTNILEDIQNKSLRMEYEALAPTFEPFVRRSTLQDFKSAARVRLGDTDDLVLMPENGEFPIGEQSDVSEKIQLATYGSRIGLSRQAIINDDLDAFSRLPAMFARKARNLEANLVYGVINANANLSDSVALFNTATHGNLAASNAAIAVASLGIGFRDMRLQTSEKGEPLNIVPRYLVVPPHLEGVARQYLGPIVPETNSNVNPWAPFLQLIVEPRLSTLATVSTTAWYLIADPMQIDTIELASLAGAEAIQTRRRDADDVLGVWWDAWVDRGVKAIDYRGMWKNAGS